MHCQGRCDRLTAPSPEACVKEITRHLARSGAVGRWGKVADGSARGGLDKIRASELPVGRWLELLGV